MSSSKEKFTIHVEGKTIICDKAILREGSEYFRAMFDSNMIECKTNETTLQEQNYDIVKTLIDSLETGELAIGDNVEELVEGAVMLQVKSAIKSCTAYLEKTLDDTNCFCLLKLAETFGLSGLYNISKRHSLYYFNKVIKHKEFQKLTQKELIDYLSEKHLNVESELNVLDAVDLWVNSNSASEKTECLAAILECFHPEDLMEGEWEDAVKKHILADTEAGKQWLNSHSKPSSTTGEQYRELPVMFLTVGGILPGQQCGELDEPVPDICRYDKKEKRFVQYRSLHEIYKELGVKMGYSICTFGQYMYISGGQVDLLRNTYETKVWRFDSFTEKWDHLTDMLSCRRHHGSCASEGRYYILGGFGKYRKCLNTFEEYDLEKDNWLSLSNMPNPLFGMEVAKTKGKLFAFKGYCYCYDFVTKSWTELDCPEKVPVYPVYYHRNLYVFPKDERWTLQQIIEEPAENTKLHKVLTCPLDGNTFEMVNISENFNANSTNIVAIRNRFYYIQRIHYGERNVFRGSESYKFQLVSGLFDDFQQVFEIGETDDWNTELTNLVALPRYPEFKCLSNPSSKEES